MACSCYLTSDFDGLTADTGGGGGSSSVGTGTGMTSTSSSAGGGGAGGGGGGITGDPAFPATKILDDFNRPDGPPGAPWEEAIDGSYEISSEQLATQNGNPDAIIWDEDFGPRQEVFVTLSSFMPDDAELEVILRNQGNPSECDSIVGSYNTFSGPPHAIVVDYCTNGDFIALGPPVEVTLVPGDQIGLRGYEDGTVKLYRNGEELGSYDATVWVHGKSGGRIGVYATGLGSVVRYDDFGGGEY